MNNFFSRNYKNDRIKDQNSTTQYQSNLDIPLRIQEEYFSSSIFNVETIIRLKKYHLHFVSFLRWSPDGPSPTGISQNSLEERFSDTEMRLLNSKFLEKKNDSFLVRNFTFLKNDTLDLWTYVYNSCPVRFLKGTMKVPRWTKTWHSRPVQKLDRSSLVCQDKLLILIENIFRAKKFFENFRKFLVLQNN